EGTFGLECLIDELAAKLELDPLELRRKNYADSNDDKPFSSKNLKECYDLARKHWDRRDEVRARSTDTWKRGVGVASQIRHGSGREAPDHRDRGATLRPRRTRARHQERRRLLRGREPLHAAGGAAGNPRQLADSREGRPRAEPDGNERAHLRRAGRRGGRRCR